MRLKTLLGMATVGLSLIFMSSSFAASFIVSSQNWGKRQDAAVKAAGGTVLWSHKKAGLASVSSDNPDFLDLISADRAIQSAAEDMMVQWQDTSFTELGDIDPTTEFFYGLQWNMRAISAPEAWEAGCTGDGVRVAIIDGGIDPTHPDLAPNMDAACSASFVPNEPFDSDLGGFWHGMHVAGIVGAANNGWGVMGVAPEVEMISVKALHGGRGSFSWIIGAILYSADPAAFGRGNCAKADIINMSLGAVFNRRLAGGRGGSLIAYLNRAVNYAGSKGTLVVTAAGNDGIDLGQAQDLTSVPAESGSGLAISATGPRDLAGVFGTPGDTTSPAPYSNYGEGTVFVAAPGGQPGITATLDVNSPGSIAGTKYASIAVYGPAPAGDTADVVLWTDPADTSGDPHDACEGDLDPNVAGKFALIHRGNCSFVNKSVASEFSGSVGTIISSNVSGLPPIMGGNDGGILTTPSVSITKADGSDIEGELPGVNATMNENPVGVLDQVISTCYSGWCFAYGTSMASPAAAGVAALIMSANPGISLGDLKSKLKNSADDLGKEGHDEFYGHGFVNAHRACTE